jgi:methionyl-tRNA formyltransferase
MTQLPKLLLVGNGPTSLSALESLAGRFTLLGIFREVPEDARAKDEVVHLAKTLGVPVQFQTAPADIDAAIRKLRPDCVVVSSYNRILAPEVLKTCRFVNVHYAPLPRYRGRACVNWAIINGEPCTAITIHELTAALDAGKVLFQCLVSIGARDTVTDLYQRLNQLQKDHLAATIIRYLAGDVGSAQTESEATYGCTRLPEDGEINWASNTCATFALIRGLTEPFPGAFTYLHNRRMVVWRAEPLLPPPRYTGRIPGRIVAVSRTEGYVDVLTGDGVLRISEVEVEGDIRRQAADVIRSVRITLGFNAANLLERIVRLEHEIADLAQGKAQSS